MSDDSRIIFVSRDLKKVKEFHISRVKLFTYISVFLILFLISGKFGIDFLIDFSHNSKIERLERTNTVLQARLIEITKKIQGLNKEMNLIAARDDELRTVMGVEALSSDVRKVGIGGADYNPEIKDEIIGFADKIELSRQLLELSRLEREVKLELDSYQDLMTTFQKKQDSLAYLPALRPVLHGRISSGFGRRYHPVFKVYRPHEGIDISCPRGTPIYATAAGVVKFSGINGGYGKMVILNHKYGYETRYGHMSKVLVRSGQVVKRGEKIGEVGNTGITTASHLHYEVRFKNKPVNPRLYYFDDTILNTQVALK